MLRLVLVVYFDGLSPGFWLLRGCDKRLLAKCLDVLTLFIDLIEALLFLASSSAGICNHRLFGLPTQRIGCHDGSAGLGLFQQRRSLQH